MTKTTHPVFLLLLAGAVGAGAWLSAALAQPLNACRLDAGDQAAALAEFRALRGRYGAAVSRVSLTLRLQGDEGELTRVLDRIEAREARCCATMEMSRVRTADGFDVTLAGEGPMVSTLATILENAIDPV